MAKDYAIDFYNSPAWKRCRRLYTQSKDGLCEDCLAKGIYNPGKIVHHIKHITPENINDPKITLAWSNLKLVCQDCHAVEHKGERTSKRYKFDDNGNIIYLNTD